MTTGYSKLMKPYKPSDTAASPVNAVSTKRGGMLFCNENQGNKSHYSHAVKLWLNILWVTAFSVGLVSKPLVIAYWTKSEQFNFVFRKQIYCIAKLPSCNVKPSSIWNRSWLVDRSEMPPCGCFPIMQSHLYLGHDMQGIHPILYERRAALSRAGCSICHKPCPLHGSRWALGQTKKSEDTSNNFFSKDSFCHLMITLMYAQVFIFSDKFGLN